MNFNIVLIGPTASGKTAFIKRHSEGTMLKEHNITSVTTKNEFNFDTYNNGNVTFNIYDCASDDETHWTNSDAAFIMCDVYNYKSEASKYIEIYKKINPNGYIFLIINKVELKNIKTHKYNADNVCQYSVKTAYNFEMPFRMAARHLFNDPNLCFVSLMH